MTNPVWAPALWSPTPWADFDEPEAPDEPAYSTGLDYDPWEVAVYQTADWTCSCASSAWLLNSVGDNRLGRRWQEWDVVNALRDVCGFAAVTPAYGLGRADMYDLERMFNDLGYSVDRMLHLVRDDVLAVAGRYPLQINGARFYHHVGGRAVGNGVLHLMNPAPTWRGVGQELSPEEAALWGGWNGIWLTGRLS